MEEEIWFQKNKNGSIYPKTKETKIGYCDVCKVKTKTTAHHLIPRRLKCQDHLLKDLRIRVCEECHNKFHPENELWYRDEIVKAQEKRNTDQQYIINKLNKKIAGLNSRLNKVRYKMDRIISKLNNKVEHLGKSVEHFKEVSNEIGESL